MSINDPAAEKGIQLPFESSEQDAIDAAYDDYNPKADQAYEDDGYFAEGDHDCPKQNFLDDPITQESGMGYEMLSMISCPVCDEQERQRNE